MRSLAHTVLARVAAGVLGVAGSAQLAQGALEVAGRHVFVVHPGVDALWGSYLFMVANTAAEAETTTFRVMLPQETNDWGAQDGVTQDDLSLGDGGGVQLKKSFVPGDSLLAIGFKVPGQLGSASMSFKAPADIAKIVVMARKDTLTMSGEGFVFHTDVPFSDTVYDTLSRGPVAAGEVVKVTIGRIPEGRARLWAAGAVSFLVLFALATFMALRTRPRPTVTEGI